MITLPADPGMVLLRAKDTGDLRVSRWNGSRLTYPEPMGNATEAEDRAVLGLGRVGSTAWWVQRVGAALDLYVWPKDRDEPRKTRFPDVSKEAERALWLGGDRLMVLEQYSRTPKLITRNEDAEDGESGIRVREPGHLDNAELGQFRLLPTADGDRLARLTDGVLQWLDDRLQPEDQVMLPEGQRLTDYLPIRGGEAGEAWALERGGEFVHRLSPDEAGIPRLRRSIELPGGRALRRDPILGLMLQTGQGVIRLSEGRPIELALRQSIDGREGRPSGVKEATIHRVGTTDVTGDGNEEAVLSDDRRHQLTVMRRNNGELEPLISWPVFEDRGYPYGGSNNEDLVTEPRALTGADLDGDGEQDLAMLCHDRLLLYVNREAE